MGKLFENDWGMTEKIPGHTPVLLKEVINLLNVQPGEVYIDATVGGAGYSEEIIKHNGRILGIDYDPKAIEIARRRLSAACPSSSWQLAEGNFAQIKDIAEKNKVGSVDGIVFDLGLSSYQLEDPQRGFSFKLNGPLDMRMDPSLGVTAAALVNGLTKKELADLFWNYGQEPRAKSIAAAICDYRKKKQIQTTEELASIIEKKVPKTGKINPATRCFQALRIIVNDEGTNLNDGLNGAFFLLREKGRLVVVSFHSGEDRAVKNFFADKERLGEGIVLTKKPIVPTHQEVDGNPRSRSAKLRCLIKIK